MEAKLIKQLQDAGVSAETILRVLMADMEPFKPEAKPAPEPETSPEPEPEPEPSPEPEKKPEPLPGVRKETEDVVLAAIRELTGAIQASNIINNGREKQDLSIADQADAVLTKILTGQP